MFEKIILILFILCPSMVFANCEEQASNFKKYLDTKVRPLVGAEVLKDKYRISKKLNYSENEFSEKLDKILDFDLLFKCQEEDPRTKQAEFSMPIWGYTHSENLEFLNKGYELLNEHKNTLQNIENTYGVEKEILISIWGRETKFGEKRGNIYVVSAVTQLAYQRNSDFWRNNIVYAVRIMLENDLLPNEFIGSWAGAFGHMQFIPSTYAKYAVDFDKDGKSAHWDSQNPIDAWASAANLLKQSGWTSHQNWFQLITLKDSFDYFEYFQEKTNYKDLSYWISKSQNELKDLVSTKYKLFSPHGSKELRFLVDSNFDVIKTYNNADFYAFSVLLFAKKMKEPRLNIPWKKEAGRILTFNENWLLQTMLNHHGFNVGTPDGLLGKGSQLAILNYQKKQEHSGLAVDGFASEELFFNLVEKSQDLIDSLQKTNNKTMISLLQIYEGTLSKESSPLSLDQRKEVQNILISQGYNIGSAQPDGIIGAMTLNALSKALGIPSENIYLNQKVLKYLKK